MIEQVTKDFGDQRKDLGDQMDDLYDQRQDLGDKRQDLSDQREDLGNQREDLGNHASDRNETGWAKPMLLPAGPRKSHRKEISMQELSVNLPHMECCTELISCATGLKLE